jgi:hypothetical protein
LEHQRGGLGIMKNSATPQIIAETLLNRNEKFLHLFTAQPHATGVSRC